jgi:hypothetical protein
VAIVASRRNEDVVGSSRNHQQHSSHAGLHRRRSVRQCTRARRPAPRGRPPRAATIPRAHTSYPVPEYRIHHTRYLVRTRCMCPSRLSRSTQVVTESTAVLFDTETAGDGAATARGASRWAGGQWGRGRWVCGGRVGPANCDGRFGA